MPETRTRQMYPKAVSLTTLASVCSSWRLHPSSKPLLMNNYSMDSFKRNIFFLGTRLRKVHHHFILPSEKRLHKRWWDLHGGIKCNPVNVPPDDLFFWRNDKSHKRENLNRFFCFLPPRAFKVNIGNECGSVCRSSLISLTDISYSVQFQAFFWVGWYLKPSRGSPAVSQCEELYPWMD